MHMLLFFLATGRCVRLDDATGVLLLWLLCPAASPAHLPDGVGLLPALGYGGERGVAFQLPGK
jgi:hypothetical protein